MTSNQSSDRRNAARRPRRPADPPEPWLRIGTTASATLPLAGQPGHGRTASLRRQPARIVDGRIEGGYTDAFELVCGHCGANPCIDHREIPAWLQRIRGPYTLEAGLAAYETHLGLT